MSFIQHPAAPNLPLAPGQYDSRYQEQFNNVLRLYFNRLNNNLLSLFGPDGGRFLSNPFGAWSSDSDQVAVSTTAAYAITYDVTDVADSVTLVDDSKMTVRYSGVISAAYKAMISGAFAFTA